MRSVSAYFGFAIFAAGAALTGAACTSDRDGFSGDAEPPPFTSEEAGLPSDCASTVHCSRDLKSVIQTRCDGSEVATACDPGQGCGDGVCVDACKSAEISKGSIGCAFATLPPDESSGAQGSCFAAMVANVWDRPVTLKGTYGGDAIDIAASTYYADISAGSIKYVPTNGVIEPGKVGIVFLAGVPAPATYDFTPCPASVVPAVQKDPIVHKTGRTKAFGITADAPVSAYSIFPYNGANTHTPAATLLLPTSSWDKNYIAVSTWNPSPGAPDIQIVAAEDGTEVTMRPNVDIIGGGGVESILEGESKVWTLNRGEVIQITQRGDTSGSPIESNKPIGLFGGSECTYMMGSACDVTQQQIPPVSQWGSNYALVPWRPRTGAGVGYTTARETIPWRMVGAANGTKLIWDPAPPGGAPETLEAGQVVTFVSNMIATVRSQDEKHPFYAGMFMTGGEPISRVIGVPQGDPDFVNVVPSDQFLDHYIFFVDPTYAESTLTFVRRKTAAGFKPVTLECAGELGEWQPLGDSGEYEFAWVYLTKRGQPQKVGASTTTCGYGRQDAHSDGPFGVYVWGTAEYSSYGYAGGTGSRPLSDVKGPPVK